MGSLFHAIGFRDVIGRQPRGARRDFCDGAITSSNRLRHAVVEIKRGSWAIVRGKGMR